MYYQKLKKLRDYDIPEDIIIKLEEIFRTLTKKRVSPLILAQKLNIAIDLAFNICLSLVKEELASVRYEITCPECSADVLIINDLREIPKTEITCDVCGESFIPTQNDIWIVFDFFLKEDATTKRGKIEDSHSSGIRLGYAFSNPLFEEITDNELFQINREKLREMLMAVENARTNDEKKKSLENLAEYLFSSLHGWKCVGRNTRTTTSEIDLIFELDFWVYGLHPFFKEFGHHIIVECKNWKIPVGSSEIRDFAGDMRKRRVKFGFLITKEGISKDAFEEIKDIYKTEGLVIIVISKEDIEQIISEKNFIKILKEKYRKIKFT